MSGNFKRQLKQNLLAILSLVIALSALGYNSWWNVVTESNRNYRAAGFEIIRECSHLQLVIDTVTYSETNENSLPIDGWVKVNLIVNLAELMKPDIKKQAAKLKKVWTDNWKLLDSDENANGKIWNANKALIDSVNSQLKQL